MVIATLTPDLDEVLDLFVACYRMTKRKRAVLRHAREQLDPAAYAALLERLYR